MSHLSEEQLVLYYYGEAEDLRTAEEHLGACDDCRARFQGLQATLKDVSLPVPERGEEYGAQVWRQLRPRLEEPQGWNWADLFRPRRLVWAGAMATLLLAAFLLGRFWPRPAVELAQPATPQVRERILLVAVGDHLQRSEMVLIELMNAEGNGTVDISAEQGWAEELVAANRLYRQTASRSGEAGVASVLEELERMLLEIAHSPSEVSASELEAFRQRIEARGILFKVRVIGSQVREREKTFVQQQGQGRS
jgi:hypothetical protein